MFDEDVVAVPVVASEVAGDDRLSFLPRYFGQLMLEGERCVYGWMRELCEGYTGGEWKFHELSNGGFYLALDTEQQVRLQVTGNYFDGEMSADAAGVVVTLFALNYLVNKYGRLTDMDYLLEHYYWLRDYAGDHPEGVSIFQAID